MNSGCYPCSRRRIHCDRTEPTCHKCAARGLQCTGLGLKLRFPYGAPVSVSTISEAPGTSHLSRPNAFRANDPAFASRSRYDQTFPPEVLHGFGSTEHLPPSVSLSNGDISHSTTSSSQQHVSKDLCSYSAFGASVELERHETSLARFNQIGGIHHIPTEITPLWKRIMCKYCECFII